MAEVHNPTRYPMFCHPLKVILNPHGTVHCSDEDVAKVSTAVFQTLTTAECRVRDDELEAEKEREAAEAEAAAAAPKRPVVSKKAAAAAAAKAKDTTPVHQPAAAFASINGTVTS